MQTNDNIDKVISYKCEIKKENYNKEQNEKQEKNSLTFIPNSKIPQNPKKYS
jgi:hypothetical protein